jgi:signal transduction histidine kinase/CheY-like chemotaxis protein
MTVSGVLDAALALASHLGAEHSYVLVLEPGDKTYFRGTVPGLANLDDSEAAMFGQLIATRGLEKWVLENRQPALVTDSRTDTRWYTAPQHIEEEPARAVVAVPIFGPRSEISGVLAYTHPRPGHFDEEDVQLVELIGQSLATALDNARLFEQTQAALTERQRAEDERFAIERKLLETQKLESLGVLAGGIAHDFNNLLVSILGNVGLALLDLEPMSPVREPVEQIKVAAQRAAELTRQMLAYSGKGRFVVQRLNLNSVIDEMTQLMKVSISKNAILKMNLSPRIPAIEGDATQIRQIVMNLIVNASDAIGNKEGIITLSTGVVRADRLYLSQAFLAPDLPEGDYAYLEIADTGIGMDQETLAKIFDPFFTTKFTGRGLGLAAVLGIVRGHKGAIRVYSEAGRGSTFRILLPSIEAPVETRSDDDGNGANHGSGTILIVDDEEIVRKVTRRMLERYGYNVMIAEDGRRAIDMFHGNPSAVDCVLLDMTMPGLSGDETFRELRRIKPDAVVVLMSGYTEQDATSRFSGKGLAGFLQKPYTPQDLREKISGVLQNGNGKE